MKGWLARLSIPTARRPGEARAAVESWGAAFVRSGSEAAIEVHHLPSNQAEENAYVAALAEAAHAGISASYLGMRARLGLAMALRRETGVGPEVLDFALFNPLRLPAAPGASRNAILLRNAGLRSLSVDDDTAARFFVRPGGEAALAEPLAPGVFDGDPSSLRILDGEAGWTREAVEVQADLPRLLDGLWNSAAAAGTPAPLIFPGLAGDCGWSAPFGLWNGPLGYLLLDGASLRQLCASEEAFRSALLTREVLRVSPKKLLARGAPGMSTVLGLDGTQPLPPFLPVGRGEDLLFTALCERLVAPQSGHLPLAILHRPLQPRRFEPGEVHRNARSFDLPRLFFALLEGPTDLAGLGAHFSRLGALSPPAFGEAVREARQRHGARQVADARARAAEMPGLPGFWRDEVLRYCELFEQGLREPGTPWLVDVQAADAEASLRTAAELVKRMGALCTAWPALWTAARGIAEEPVASLAATRPTLRERPGPWPASPYQLGLWALQELAPESNAYNVFRAFRLRGPVDAKLLERALQAVAERHEPLRTVLRADAKGAPMQELRDSCDLRLEQHQPPDETALRKLQAEEVARPFDLAKAPPLRAQLLTLPSGEHELWLTVHHIALDGASEHLLWEELAAAWANLRADRPAAQGLEPLRTSYRQLAALENAWLRSPAAAESTAYWRTLLQPPPVLPPLGRRAPSGKRTSACARRSVMLPRALLDRLEALGRAEQSSLFVVCLGAFLMLLALWTGETDVVVGAPFANRAEEESLKLIGLFVNVVPLRTAIAPDEPFRALVQRTKAQVAQAFAHGRIPLREMSLHGRGAQGRLPFDATFNMLNLEPRVPRLEGLEVEEREALHETARFDLTFYLQPGEAGLSTVVAYDTDLFAAEDVEQLLAAWTQVLTLLCEEPASTLARLSEQVVPEASLPQAVSPAGEDDLLQSLEAICLAHEGKLAATGASRALRYGELHALASSVARALVAKLPGRGHRVALSLAHDAPLAAAVLGVLASGNTYVPLDPSYPAARLQRIASDARVELLLEEGTALPLPGLPRLRLGDIALGGKGPLATALPAELPAYILYTSGSTGNPKGVVQLRRNVAHFADAYREALALQPADRQSWLASLNFDAAMVDLFSALRTGSSLHLRNLLVEGLAGLPEWAAREGITVYHSIPSVLSTLLEGGLGEMAAALRAIVLGGEPVPPTLVANAKKQLGAGAALVNLYGATEGSIWAMGAVDGSSPVTLPPPLAGDAFLVRGAAGFAAFDGELWVASPHLTPGYWDGTAPSDRAPGESESRFLQLDGRRAYRTFDAARLRPSARTELRGRLDGQIKLAGRRLELGELETALAALSGVGATAACAVPRGEGPEPARLEVVAHFEAAADGPVPELEELRAQLAAVLPPQLVPRDLRLHARLPRLPNGKLDRQELRRLSAAPARASAPVASPAAPLSAEEQFLVAEFRSILGQPDLHADSNFFAEGGDSLGALRLIARIDARFGVRMLSGELFACSTPRQLARRLTRGPATQTAGKHLTAMRSGGSGPPLFFVHPIGGQITPYLPLLRHLDPEIPFFAMQAEAKDGTSYGSLRERAAVYLREIVEHHRGHLYLGGYSLGGILAYEIATQLAEAGARNVTLFLLDSFLPVRRMKTTEKIAWRLSELAGWGWKDRARWLRSFVGNQLQPDRRKGFPASIATFRSQLLEWRPRPFDGEMVLFRAERHVEGYPSQRGARGWEALCNHIELHVIGCDHSQLALEPWVNEAAAAISARLVGRRG
jgi:non-ribosomal peptide synthetase component F/thioesterase domain-containing protein/acyl carrier protein